MSYVCPECGGNLKSMRGVLICLRCGLTFKRHELKELMDSLKASIAEKNEEERRKKEYLKWWLSRKDS